MRNPFAYLFNRKTPNKPNFRSQVVDLSQLVIGGNMLTSADQVNQLDCHSLRLKARNLARTNPYACKYLQMVSSNVAGPNGITMTSKFTSARGNLHTAVNRKIEDSWYDYGKKSNLMVDGRLDMVGFQRLAAITLATDGEVLIRKVFNKSKHGMQLQLIDVDQLVSTDQLGSFNGNRVVDGVEVDEWGKPLAYHIFTQHPGDIYQSSTSFQKRIRIPASEIIHAYRPARPGQTRGLTRFHPVIRDLEIIQEYITAELRAAEAGAKKLVVLTANTVEAELALQASQEAEQAAGGEGRAILLSDTSQGMSLPAGYDLKALDIQHPSTAFPDFLQGVLRSVASGLSVNYNALASNLEATSYSSIRSGTLEERENWRENQVWFAQNILQPIYESWLEAQIALGRLQLTGQIEAYTYVSWNPKGWIWVDPAKEANAQVIAISAGLKSRTALLAESGVDIRELYEEIAEENRLADEYGLNFETSAWITQAARPEQALTTEETKPVDQSAETTPDKKPSKPKK